MDLKKYDGRRVRLETVDGDVFEGIVTHNSRDYTFHEYGAFEESLQMPFFLFYGEDIKSIDVLPDGGPYGGYTGRYSRLEEIVVSEGADGIEEVLWSEEPEHIYRLLLCIGDRLARGKDSGLPGPEKLKELLTSFPVPDDEAVKRQLDTVLAAISC